MIEVGKKKHEENEEMNKELLFINHGRTRSRVNTEVNIFTKLRKRSALPCF